MGVDKVEKGLGCVRVPFGQKAKSRSIAIRDPLKVPDNHCDVVYRHRALYDQALKIPESSPAAIDNGTNRHLCPP